MKEYEIDCWIIFVRETESNPDPIMDLVVGGDVVWDSAFIFVNKIVPKPSLDAKAAKIRSNILYTCYLDNLSIFYMQIHLTAYATVWARCLSLAYLPGSALETAWLFYQGAHRADLDALPTKDTIRLIIWEVTYCHDLGGGSPVSV